jgi:hypothetical protein
VRNEVGLDVSHHARISQRGGEMPFFLDILFHRMSEIAIFRPTTRGSLVLAKESELWETVGMAKPKARYVPRMNDPVTVEGVQGTLVVVGIDARTRTALVQTMTPPQVVHRVSWTTVSCLDESQKRSLQSS